jgi:excinuclease UvrABC nuclease subunit
VAGWAEQFDERKDVQPPVGPEALGEIPAKRGVVLLCDERLEPIVMITAADMRSRCRTRLAEPLEDVRRKSPDLRQITRTIFYRRCGSAFETDWRYLELAARIWPDRWREMISWKGPWFIHIDLDEAYPYFSRTRQPGVKAGRYFGPFPTGRDADAYIDDLQDAFDLCRSITCLRRAPGGPRCAYAEMGRCVSPADGTIRMDEYRDVLRGAIRFIEGDRGRVDKLRAAMQEAAGRREYEQAAAIKHRLERIEAFDAPAFEYVRPLERFAFVLLQPSGSSKRAAVFGARGGCIDSLGVADYPADKEQLAGALSAMENLAARSIELDSQKRLRMGLVARSLFRDSSRSGVALAWEEGMTADRLAEALNAHREPLGLREPKARPQKGNSDPSCEEKGKREQGQTGAQ